MRRFILAASFAAILSGCTQPQQNTALYAAGKSLALAQGAALIYLGQPPCPAAGVKAVTCVDPATKASIKQASQSATNAYDTAIQVNAAGGSPEMVALTAATAGLAAAVPH